MNEELSKQIEKIIATSNQKEYLTNMKTMSHGIAIFYLELQLQGISMAEALVLTQEYVRSTFGKSSSD